MQYAILYVDSPPFVASPPDWASVINEWTTHMTDPAYIRVNGKPMLIVFDMGNMRSAFGSSAAVAAAFNQLRTAVKAKGLPGGCSSWKPWSAGRVHPVKMLSFPIHPLLWRMGTMR